jgi:hypothetical protein
MDRSWPVASPIGDGQYNNFKKPILTQISFSHYNNHNNII